MSKSEERLKILLEEQYRRIKEHEELLLSSRIPSIFVLGILTGIILTYSNILSVICGIFIGGIITIYYNKLINIQYVQFNEYIKQLFNNFKFINKNILVN